MAGPVFQSGYRGESIGVNGMTGPAGTVAAGLVADEIGCGIGRGLSMGAGLLPAGFDGQGWATGELPDGMGEPDTDGAFAAG